MSGTFPAKSLPSQMKCRNSNSPNGLVFAPPAGTIRCGVTSLLLVCVHQCQSAERTSGWYVRPNLEVGIREPETIGRRHRIVVRVLRFRMGRQISLSQRRSEWHAEDLRDERCRSIPTVSALPVFGHSTRVPAH